MNKFERAYILRQNGVLWCEIQKDLKHHSLTGLKTQTKKWAVRNKLLYPPRVIPDRYAYDLYCSGMSVKDIARLLGISTNGVYQRYYIAINKLNLPPKKTKQEIAYELKCKGWSYRQIADFYYKGEKRNAFRAVMNFARKEDLDIPC